MLHSGRLRVNRWNGASALTFTADEDSLNQLRHRLPARRSDLPPAYRLLVMRRPLLLAICAALLTSGCGYGDVPVTEQERRVGAEQHPQLLAQFGGAYDGDEAQYLARIGEKIAVGANLERQCTFTLVNSDVVNAFAVPGCYIYITRGLMGIVNS